MKLLVVLSLVSAYSAARLDRTYLPPFGAHNSGGNDGVLQTPNFAPHYNQQAQPQNQYGQPNNGHQHSAYSSDPNVPNAYLPPFERGQGQRNTHAQSVAQQYRPPQFNRQQQYQQGYNQDESAQFDATNDESFPNSSQNFGFQGTQGQQEQEQTRYGGSAVRFGGQPQYNNPSEFGGQREAPSFSPETGYKY